MARGSCLFLPRLCGDAFSILLCALVVFSFVHFSFATKGKPFEREGHFLFLIKTLIQCLLRAGLRPKRWALQIPPFLSS